MLNQGLGIAVHLVAIKVEWSPSHSPQAQAKARRAR